MQIRLSPTSLHKIDKYKKNHPYTQNRQLFVDDLEEKSAVYHIHIKLQQFLAQNFLLL